jgi:8-oxo-dGTP pyrophosphatase MutT (NUDIX family)
MAYARAHIERALQLATFDGRSAQKTMMPRPRVARRPPEMSGQAREGGVLAMLYKSADQTHIVLTKRVDHLGSHGGQVSFPGGRREDGETLEQTALREAEEEIGIDRAKVTILGELTPLYIMPSDYEVHPFVAWYEGRPLFSRQMSEVAEILEVPLTHLLDPANRFEEPWTIRGYQLQVPYYLFGEHKVWGATAMMLGEFLERLRAAGISSAIT